MGAKRVQISTDGVTWYSFPGAGGEFSADSAGIDDTILGQDFGSEERGLASWSIKTDGIYKGYAGYSAVIKKGGTPVAVTGEACALESGKIYAISTAARQIWSRSASVVVYDGGVDHTADVEWIDYLFGRVKFNDSYTVGGAVTVDVSYIPTAVVGCGKSYTLNMTAATKDESCFDAVQSNGYYSVFAAGLKSVSLDLEGIFRAADGLLTLLTARTELIIEVDPTGTGASIARGFFKAASTGQSGDVGAVEDATTSFMLSVPYEVDNPEVYLPFRWKHTSTTLATAIQLALTSWENNLNTYQVQYLPQGAAGQTPNDGAKGAVVVTNVTLSGGLSEMNVFTAEFTGTGAVTVV